MKIIQMNRGFRYHLSDNEHNLMIKLISEILMDIEMDGYNRVFLLPQEKAAKTRRLRGGHFMRTDQSRRMT